MSRKLFIAGNWKMNTCNADAMALAKALSERVGQVDAVDLAVAPPFVYIPAVVGALAGSKIDVAAQNVCYRDNGAYTGEISTAMLTDIGCRYAIVGHSERRHVFGETDEGINNKVIKALADGLDVILCVGEKLDQRKAGQTTEVVAGQVTAGLKGVAGNCPDGQPLADRLTLAYEPVWAIGTGETATPDQAQEVHAMIRKLLADLYDDGLAGGMRIQYGGSVKPSNAADLLGQEDIDGALVGGASLTADDFVGIVDAGMG